MISGLGVSVGAGDRSVALGCGRGGCVGVNVGSTAVVDVREEGVANAADSLVAI